MERYYSPQLENFLCFSTRFQADERLTVEQALNHIYFANFDAETYLAASRPALLGQLRLFVRGEKTSVPKFHAANMLKLLCAYYIKGERWYMLRDAFAEVEEDRSATVLHRESAELEYLHYELGVDMDFLWHRLAHALTSNYQVGDT